MDYIADTFYKNEEKPPVLATISIIPYKGIENITLADYSIPAATIGASDLEPSNGQIEEQSDGEFCGKKFDCYTWAEEFCRIFAQMGQANPSVDWVASWMANAYMKGVDEFSQKTHAPYRKYSIGDLVVLTRDIKESDIMIAEKGTIGEIICTHGSDYEFDYEIFVENMDDELHVYEYEITLALEQNSTTLRNFTVGDIVKIKVPYESDFNGMQGVISELYAEDRNNDYNVSVAIVYPNDANLSGEYSFKFSEITFADAIENTITPELDEIIPF